METHNNTKKPQPDNIECHLQQIGMGTLLCRAAHRTSRGHDTNEVTPEICAECEVGKIYREVGCDAVTAKILLTPVMGPQRIMQSIQSIFCPIRKTDTDLEYCRTCDLVVAPTTKQIVTTARALFTDDEFFSAYKDLETARHAIRDGEFEDAITASIACLESTMRVCHERLGEPLPHKKQVTDLWRSTRAVLGIDQLSPSGGVDHLLNALSGAVSHLGAIRSELGDAHGKGLLPPLVTQAIAELALNTAAVLSTFIVRCFKERQTGEDQP